MSLPPIEILKGYAALRIGRYWVGIWAGYPGQCYCPTRRRTAQAALKDAKQAHDRQEWDEPIRLSLDSLKVMTNTLRPFDGRRRD